MRLLWKLGSELPPPQFMRFSRAALLTGSWFAFGWGLASYLVLWRELPVKPLQTAIGVCIAGVLYGVLMAFIYMQQRKRHELPSWDELGRQ